MVVYVSAGEVLVRRYDARDAAEIVRLFYETIHSVNRAHYSQEQIEAWAPEIPDAAKWHSRLSGRHTLVAERDGEVVGFAELEDDGHLDTMFCRTDAVGKGIGSRLYQAIEHDALQRGVARIFTEASITARPFFERHGFRVVGEQKVLRRDVELTNFAMEKRLHPPIR